MKEQLLKLKNTLEESKRVTKIWDVAGMGLAILCTIAVYSYAKEVGWHEGFDKADSDWCNGLIDHYM